MNYHLLTHPLGTSSFNSLSPLLASALVANDLALTMCIPFFFLNVAGWPRAVSLSTNLIAFSSEENAPAIMLYGLEVSIFSSIIG